MAVKFRAMTPEDYSRTGNIVSSPGNVDSYDVLSRHSYTMQTHDVLRNTSDEHMRSVIKLNAPIFNYVLGRSRCSLLQKILGFDMKTWHDIDDVNLIYDCQTNQLVDINEAKQGNKYLFGAEIACKFIEDLDIEARKVRCLIKALAASCKDNAPIDEIFKINKAGVGEKLTAGYYVEINKELYTENVKRGKDPEKWRDIFFETLFPNNDTVFTYLVNMKQDKSGLWGMINNYIAVVPEAMRPKVERGEHKLTAAYTRVIKANFEYKATVSEQATIKDIRTRYLALRNAVSKLQYKNVDLKQANTAKDDLSVLERVKSKTGQIRKNNLGKRQDYSGRSVVCSNPFLPMDHLRIPNDMIPKLYEFHALPELIRRLDANAEDKQQNKDHARTIYDNIHLTDLTDKRAQEVINKIIDEMHLLDKYPVVMGRQPTLHKQSIQGFHAERTDNHAIEVSPLVVTAYNMDFDGDQAWLAVYLSYLANLDVTNLLMTSQNIYLAKTGESTIEPRQDMLYGLYICTRADYQLGTPYPTTFLTLEGVRQAVMNQIVKVDQTILCNEFPQPVLAGEAALMACFRPGDLTPRNVSHPNVMQIKEITKKTIGSYMSYLLRTDAVGNKVYPLGTGYAPNTTFVGAINRMVELGFRVAEIYSASLTLITEETQGVKDAIAQFHEDMSDAYYYYGIGLETTDNYKIEFDQALSKLEERTNVSDLGFFNDQNGYALLSKSGARGSKDNLKQAFVYKGRVKKNSTESFDALIENSYGTQLSPMEQQINAFGGRQGQIDKSLKTGDTGYASRKMWHATQGVKIVSDDCGATSGMKVSKKALVALTRTPDIDGAEADALIQAEVKEMFIHAIVGRYRVGGNKVITETEAEQWANDADIDTIEIRSPLKCRNMCCKKCYGIDPSSHRLPPEGTLVGVIGAQAIGEPQNQIVLKTFQSGGVVGSGVFTSAFDKVKAYTAVADLKAAQKRGAYAGYDPLAWGTGDVVEKPTSDLNSKRVTIDGCPGNIIIPKDVVLKKHVEKGEGIAFKHGDYCLREIINILGIEEAQRYLVFKLFNLYKSEVKIMLVHFEILTACMTRYMILSTDRDDLMIGQYCTAGDLYSGSVANTEFRPTLISIDELPQCSLDAMDGIIMENQSRGLSRACLLGLFDRLEKPLNRMVLGMSIKGGSYYPDYIDERKEPI